jgi:predicted PurR-regulated permease PerM
VNETQFRDRLTGVALGLLIVVLVVYLLREFGPILRPLLVAGFITYLIVPAHRRLVARGVPSALAYVLIVALVAALFLGLGQAVYLSFAGLTAQTLAGYEHRLDRLVNDVLELVPLPALKPGTWKLRDQLTATEGDSNLLLDLLRTLLGTFLGFLTGALTVLFYLVFLLAEHATLPRRLALAFGAPRAEHLLVVAGSINEAIARYIAVKTWISFLTGFSSFVVLAVFGVEFALLWGVLIFLFNFIPYIGSWGAILVPILLSFVQFDTPWIGVTVLVLLVLVQVVTGALVEPRLTGRRLDLSPLGIVVALSFWGFIWGVVGMILAVPLTVIIKIILDNIDETRPVATLMSNV